VSVAASSSSVERDGTADSDGSWSVPVSARATATTGDGFGEPMTAGTSLPPVMAAPARSEPAVPESHGVQATTTAPPRRKPVVVAGLEFSASAKEAREKMKKKADKKQDKLSLRDKYELLQKL